MSNLLNIAVVGSGAAGISAAYYSEKQGAIVTVFESQSRIGGHANPIEVSDGLKQFRVDTGFLIFNKRTYPTFVEFLEELEIYNQTSSTEMSSSFCNYDSNMFYSLGQPVPLKAKASTFLKLRFYKIFLDLMKFRSQAHADLISGSIGPQITIKDYLIDYSVEFKENFVYPLTSAIWSLPESELDQYPARSIINYFYNHGLLNGKSDRQWRTFPKSSLSYIKTFKKKSTAKFLLNQKVTEVKSQENSASLISNGVKFEFDAIILATPAPVSHKLLTPVDYSLKRVLKDWKYNKSLAVLHTDSSVMPRQKSLWSSWNVSKIENRYDIHYFLNRVHNLASGKNLFLSLNPQTVADRAIIDSFTYEHPIFTQESVRSQETLALRANERIQLCGSYFGHGFHEDAFYSGKTAALSIFRSNKIKEGPALRSI